MEPSEEIRRRARLGSAAKPPGPIPPRSILNYWLVATAAGVVAPLARRMRRDARGGPRRLLIRVGADALFRFLVVDAFTQWSARQTINRIETEQRLRAELGRPPWPEELERALMEDR
jgi:hypothetical protein